MTTFVQSYQIPCPKTLQFFFRKQIGSFTIINLPGDVFQKTKKNHDLKECVSYSLGCCMKRLIIQERKE
jgi:hypothetical protein